MVDNLAKRFDRISPIRNNRKNGISYWKDKMIIPLEDWTLLNASEALEYFPDDLFRLSTLAFTVEISLAKTKKDDSEIRIKNKEELLHALTDKETFVKILEQGAEAQEVGENIKRHLREHRTYIIDYFMRIKDLVTAEELRFY